MDGSQNRGDAINIFKYILSVLIIITLVGCNQNGNPRPSDYLKDEGADIFMLDSYVYSNVKNIDWVEDTEYILGKQIGEVKKQTNKSFGFNDGTANKLPVGTKIYETNSPIVVAFINGEQIPYLKMVEG